MSIISEDYSMNQKITYYVGQRAFGFHKNEMHIKFNKDQGLNIINYSAYRLSNHIINYNMPQKLYENELINLNIVKAFDIYIENFNINIQNKYHLLTSWTTISLFDYIKLIIDNYEKIFNENENLLNHKIKENKNLTQKYYNLIQELHQILIENENGKPQNKNQRITLIKEIVSLQNKFLFS